MTFIVFRGDIVKENKSLIAGFIKVWEESLAWTLDNPGKAAEKAAAKARFNAIGGVENQRGTITYNFKLK